MLRYRLILLLMLLVGLVSLAQAETAVPTETAALEATADTTLASALPSTSFGATSPLRLGSNTNQGFQRILLQFDVTQLPTNIKTVTRAYLYLYQNGHAPEFDAPMNINAHHVTSPWNEQIATWSNSSNKAGDQRGTAAFPRETGFYELDITNLAEDWRTGRLDNYGVILLGSEDLNALRERSFGTREGSAPFRPRLFFDYIPFNDNAPPTAAVNPLPTSTFAPFTVSWSGSDVGEAGIYTYDVQVRQNSGAWTDWITQTMTTSKLFDTAVAGSVYEFRARAIDRAYNQEAYSEAEAITLYGANPAQATVNALPGVTQSVTFAVSWTKTAPAGWEITGVDVRYRFYDGVLGQWTAWADWQVNSTADNAPFTAPYGDGLYQFEARADSPQGIHDEFTGTAEASTFLDVVAPFINPRLWLPLVRKG